LKKEKLTGVSLFRDEKASDHRSLAVKMAGH
jgi:hypothetical protein